MKFNLGQILNINAADLSDTESNDYAERGATEYGTVEFNNSVANQTVNVYNGMLKLGTYAGGLDVATVAEQGYAYTTDASIASLSNVGLTVYSGATINVATNDSFDSVCVASGSSIVLEDGATLLLDAFASLSFDSSSTIEFAEGVSVVIDFGNYSLDDFSYTLFYFEDSDLAEEVYTFLNDDSVLELIAIDGDYDLALSTGADENGYYSIVISSAEEVEVVAYTMSLMSFSLMSTSYSYSAPTIMTMSSNTAVPEPSDYALFVSIASLLFVAIKRRKN